MRYLSYFLVSILIRVFFAGVSLFSLTTAASEPPPGDRWITQLTNLLCSSPDLDAEFYIPASPLNLSYGTILIADGSASYAIEGGIKPEVGSGPILGQNSQRKSSLWASGAPVITQQPTNITGEQGATIRLRALVQGIPPLYCSWQKDGTNLSNERYISGVTNLELTIADLRTKDFGRYRLVVSNILGNAISQEALVLVNRRPPEEVRWVSSVYSWLTSPALGTDGTIYVGSSDGHLYALDELTGTAKWKFAAGGPIFHTPAVGTNQIVYVNSEETKSIYALNATNGTKIRNTSLDYPSRSTFAIGADGTVFFGAASSMMAYALNPVTGSPTWSLPWGSLFGYPVLASGQVIMSGSECICALDEKLGQVRWAISRSASWISAPSIDRDGTIYASTHDGVFGQFRGITALNPVDGSERWSFNFGKTGSAPIIGPDGILYVVREANPMPSATGVLYALNGSRRTIEWSAPLDGYAGYSSPTLSAQGTIYIGTSIYFYAIDSRTGQQKWMKPQWNAQTSPAIDPDGKIYVSVANQVYALYGDGPLADSPWPMEGQNSQRTSRLPDSWLVMRLYVSRTIDHQVQLQWLGNAILQSADAPAGPWNDIVGAQSPWPMPVTGPLRYFRLKRRGVS